MRMKKSRRLALGGILALILAFAAFFLRRGAAEDAGTEWEWEWDAGDVVLEYRWREGENPVSVRYVSGAEEFYLYDGYRQVCRIEDPGTTKSILSLEGEAADASGFTACFAEHEEGLILYQDSFSQAVRAVLWLENEGAMRLYSVTCGDYADLYYQYKGKQYRLLLCMEDEKAAVCFAPLETEISTPDRKEILRQLKQINLEKE